MELWIRKDSLPPRGSQHSSTIIQVQRILSCTLSVHPECPSIIPQDGGVLRVDNHPEFPEYLLAVFRTHEVAKIALHIFNGMNLGNRITDKLDFQPINLVVEWPEEARRRKKFLAHQQSKSAPAPVLEECVREDKIFNFRNTMVYIREEEAMNENNCRKEIGRLELVIGLDRKNNDLLILQDGSKIPRSPHGLKQRGIKLRYLTPAQFHEKRVQLPEKAQDEPVRKKSKGLPEEDTNRVLVEIRGPGDRIRNRFLPVEMTMGEILKCCDNGKNVCVVDEEHNYILSRSIKLSHYSGCGHVRIRLTQQNLRLA